MFARTIRILREDGVAAFLKRIPKYPLKHGFIAPHLKDILGKTFHQKLFVYPHLGYWPQIRQPRTFNEKILHRKLFTDNDAFSIVEDKWRVREYVEERVNQNILTDIYHVTEDPETIPFDQLPNEFVIKPTHLSGSSIIFVDDKSSINREKIKRQCEAWLDEEYGEIKGEYWYKNIRPRIIVEERLRDEEHGVPLDYKFFVFHGDVEYIQVDYDRFSSHTRRLYDSEWVPQDFTLKHPLGPETEKPQQLERMIDIAETLAQDFDFIRVDLYQPNGERVVFGELTVAHGSGAEPFTPRDWDFVFGSLW
jgi:hypothetical protein